MTDFVAHFKVTDLTAPKDGKNNVTFFVSKGTGNNEVILPADEVGEVYSRLDKTKLSIYVGAQVEIGSIFIINNWFTIQV